MAGESEWYPSQGWGSDDWYEVTGGTALRQCDIIPRCPVPSPSGPVAFPISQDTEIGFKLQIFDLMILTQSCDLGNSKIETVLLAQVSSYAEAAALEESRGNARAKGRDFRKALVSGNVPGMALLKSFDGEPPMSWSLVSFKRLFTLDRNYLIQYVATCGSRLRVRPPYREHLAQAFARFIMRVGLPHDAAEFEKLGEIKG